MLCASLPGLYHQKILVSGALKLKAPSSAMATFDYCTRFAFDGRVGCWIGNEKVMWNKSAAASTKSLLKKRRLSISPMAFSALAETPFTARANFYQEVLVEARVKFTQEISFQSKDKDISLAKALLYVASEDEACMAFNREMDAYSLQNERRSALLPSDVTEWTCVEAMPLAGKNMEEWMVELDVIAKEVEAELVSREIGCHLGEVLDAVNEVLFKLRGFKRSSVLVDSKCAYLHSVLSSGCCSAILLSVIYIEVCRRLNLTIVGSPVGEEFLIWPQTGNPEELFKVTSGHSLFGVVNGKCVDDPRSKASDINSHSLSELELATNRDIIGIALANLMRLHWKRASRANHGLMLTSPLRSVDHADDKSSKTPLLRPQDLRFKMLNCNLGMRKGELRFLGAFSYSY